MKKNYLLMAFVMLGLIFGTQQDLMAQADRGAMRLGPQLGFGTEIESLGLGARFDYAVTEQILLAPDLMYWFGKSEGNVDLNWFDINLNGNYLFETANANIIPYALAGFNIAILSADYEGTIIGDFDTDATEIGFNLGGGCDFVVGNMFVFGELRYALSSADQLVIAGGVKFPLN